MINTTIHNLTNSWNEGNCTDPGGCLANASNGGACWNNRSLGVAWDMAEPTYRHEVYEDYKAGRAEADDDLVAQIERSRESVIVTDRGRPTLRIDPINRKRSVEEVFGHLRGKVRFIGDPNEPTADEWEDV